MSQTALYLLYAILAAGAAGLYLGLPSTRPDARRLRMAGAILGTATLAGIGAYLVRWMGPAAPGSGFFILFTVLAVAAAARVIIHPRPVYSALYFILVVLASTGLCILAAAEFLGAALLIIYGGAILVTYIFVIMLAQQAGEAPYDRSAREPLAAVLMGFLLVAATAQALAARDPLAAQVARSRSTYRYAIGRPSDRTVRPAADAPASARPAVPSGRPAAEDRRDGHPAEAGHTRAIGRVLMTTYVMSVEVAGILLLVALVGAIAIARKRIDPEALTPEERRQLEQRQDLHRRGRQVTPF